MSVRVIPVANPDHELHRLDRPLELRDLKKHRHIVVRDSGSKRDKKVRTLDVAQRWTVSNMSTSIGAVSRGYGFAWLPEEKIRTELQSGELKELQLRDVREFRQQLYLVFADREGAGPGLLRLAEVIRAEVHAGCLAEASKATAGNT
jgi:DNA-binding transcriptional LysR family regulator